MKATLPPCQANPSKPRTILFAQHCSRATGSTISGLIAVDGFRKRNWNVNVVLASHGPLEVRYAELGDKVEVIPYKNWVRRRKVVGAAKCILSEVANSKKFVRTLQQLRPDLVYINSLVGLAPALAAFRLGIPSVWHIRELFDDVDGEMRIPAVGNKALVRSIVNRLTSETVVISKAVQENVLGKANSRTSIIPNAVQETWFVKQPSKLESRHQLGLPKDAFIIGVPGTLRPVKGHAFFLDAAAVARSHGLNCHIAISGDGETNFKNELMQRAKAKGISETISWLGSVSDMHAFYAACDLACVPSASEPFGRTVIEAFACETPLIATSVGGVAEIVEDQKTGLLVEYGNVDQLAQTLVTLSNSPVQRERLAKNARKEAESRYRESVYQTQIADLVERAIESTK